jgi:hypothetical protein
MSGQTTPGNKEACKRQPAKIEKQFEDRLAAINEAQCAWESGSHRNDRFRAS